MQLVLVLDRPINSRSSFTPLAHTPTAGPQNAFYLVKFWADLNFADPDETGTFFGVTSQYEGPSPMTLQCSTKVCSFSKQVVEKVEVNASAIKKI